MPFLSIIMKTLSLTILLYAPLMSAVMANVRDTCMCGILVYKVKMLGRIEVENLLRMFYNLEAVASSPRINSTIVLFKV